MPPIARVLSAESLEQIAAFREEYPDSYLSNYRDNWPQSMKHYCIGGHLIPFGGGYVVTQASKRKGTDHWPWPITEEEERELRTGRVPERIRA